MPMDREWIAQHLPTEPRPEVLEWVQRNAGCELSEGWLWHESIRVPKDGYNDIYAGFIPSSVNAGTIWAALCRCSVCGETFLTKGTSKSISLYAGDDGNTYTMDPNDVDDWCQEVQVLEDDKTTCPICSAEVRLVHMRKAMHGVTKRILVQSLERVGEYGVILHWFAENEITPYSEKVRMKPKSAFVLGEAGGISKFVKEKDCGFGYGSYEHLKSWTQSGNNNEDVHCIYRDWGSINGKKMGAITCPVVPDMVGTTAEKTGLWKLMQDTYLDYIVDYVRLWKRWKPVEALVVAGHGAIVAGCVGNVYYDALQELQKYVDTGKRKPHEMLWMSKAEYREWRENTKWDSNCHREWAAYKQKGGHMSAIEFDEYLSYFGMSIRTAVELDDLAKLKRYLIKQRGAGGVTTLRDYRRMAKARYQRELTEEELWPRNLREAHDRFMELERLERNTDAAKRYAEQFAARAEALHGLVWTDGELAVVLPRSNADLIREGDVLRHCVGGYGKRHIEGSDSIFFIRHYRRPERPYYTLDICMSKDMPYRVQLHGYGNERHGASKQHSHSIPKKVTDFCDRWEKEILLPWWKEQQKKEKRA